MKITRRKLRGIISEALKDIKYATRGEEGYEFTSELPQDSQELYGQTISAGVSDVNFIKDFFKDSFVDVNIIVLPDVVYESIKSILTKKFDAAGFDPGVDNSTLSRIMHWLSSNVRGFGKELRQVREQLDENSYNIIIQNNQLNKAPTLLFDLTWITHDLIGHAVNFGYLNQVSAIKKAIGTVLKFVLGLPEFDPLARYGEFEQVLQINDGSYEGNSFETEKIDAFRQKLIADFEKENFTVGIRPDDLGASIMGYYFLKGVYPPSIEELIQRGSADGSFDTTKFQELETSMKELFSLLKGRSGLFNFGDVR